MMRRSKGPHSADGRSDNLRQKMSLLLVPVLAAVLWFLVRDSVPTTSAVSAEAADRNTTSFQETEAVNIEWKMPPLYRIGGRDPMQLASPSTGGSELAGSPAISRTGLVLRGILYTSERPVAMIGSTLALEGQQIGPVKVIQIAQDSVEFEMNGRRWRQTVVNPTIAPPADGQEQQESVPNRDLEEPQ